VPPEPREVRRLDEPTVSRLVIAEHHATNVRMKKGPTTIESTPRGRLEVIADEAGPARVIRVALRLESDTARNDRYCDKISE